MLLGAVTWTDVLRHDGSSGGTYGRVLHWCDWQKRRVLQSRCSENLREGRLEYAEQNARLALEYDAKNSEAHNCLGEVRLKQGRPAEARVLFEQAISLNDLYPQPHDNLGKLLAATDLSAAIRHFKAAFSIDPHYATARVDLSDALLRQGDFEEALKELTACTSADPSWAPCWDALGRVSFERQRYEEAEPLFEKTIALDPDNPRGWLDLCAVRLKLGNCSQAVDACNEALARNTQWRSVEVRETLVEALRCASAPAAK